MFSVGGERYKRKNTVSHIYDIQITREDVPFNIRQLPITEGIDQQHYVNLLDQLNKFTSLPCMFTEMSNVDNRIWLNAMHNSTVATAAPTEDASSSSESDDDNDNGDADVLTEHYQCDECISLPVPQEGVQSIPETVQCAGYAPEHNVTMQLTRVVFCGRGFLKHMV